MNGVLLPSNVKVIAACNPYRLKKGLSAKEDTMAGLIFDHYAAAHLENVGTGITDPLKNLVYRVHPLPESMIGKTSLPFPLCPGSSKRHVLIVACFVSLRLCVRFRFAEP